MHSIFRDVILEHDPPTQVKQERGLLINALFQLHFILYKNLYVFTELEFFIICNIIKHIIIENTLTYTDGCPTDTHCNLLHHKLGFFLLINMLNNALKKNRCSHDCSFLR